MMDQTERYIRAMARALASQAQEGYRTKGPGAILIGFDAAGRLTQSPAYVRADALPPEIPVAYDPARSALIVVLRRGADGDVEAYGVFTIAITPGELPPQTMAHLGDWIMRALHLAQERQRAHGRGLVVISLVPGTEPLRFVARSAAGAYLTPAGLRALDAYASATEALVLVRDGADAALAGLWRVPFAAPDEAELISGAMRP